MADRGMSVQMSGASMKGMVGGGEKGRPGWSAYQIAVMHGYEGTEEEWLASLVGPQGATGEQGETGEQGPKGATGEVTQAEFDAVAADVTQLKSDFDVLEDVYSVDHLVTRNTIINDINSKVTLTVDPSVTSYRVIKGYDVLPITDVSKSFLVFAKISSANPNDHLYNIRAQKITSGGGTATYYWALDDPVSNGVIVGKVSGMASDCTGLKFQVVRKYNGSAESSFSETFSIDYVTVIDSDVSYYGDKASILLDTFNHTPAELWERGYYSNTTGNVAGSDNANAIRTKKEMFIPVCAGSVIGVKSGSQELYYCVYTKPFVEYFVSRTKINGGSYVTITNDCYIRVFMQYNDSREFNLDTWISQLPALWYGKITQYKPMILDDPIDPVLNDTSENAVQNKVITPILSAVKPKYFLSDDWESKYADILTAKDGKFSFVIQTDTHYVFNDNENTGTDLRILTNKTDFDFVANLGDIIEGYGTDSNVLMRASMMQIMNRYTDGVTAPFLVAMGNHETNAQTTDGNPAKIPFSYTEVFGREFVPAYETIPNAVKPTGVTNPMYYYVDFLYTTTVPGVRVIVLNTQDGSHEGAFGIGSDQLNWLTNTALDTDLPVIIMSHVPLINGIANRTDYNYHQSFADVVTALQTFKTGGGTIIACLAGHMHEQANKVVDDINYIVFRNGFSRAEAVFVDLSTYAITTKTLGFNGDRSFT